MDGHLDSHLAQSSLKRKQDVAKLPANGTSTPPSSSSPSSRMDNAAGTSDEGFTRVPTREEKRKHRKLDRHRPQFQFDLSHFHRGKKIGIAHIRDLVLYIVADGQRPSWLVLENQSFVSHTVVLLAPGLLPEHLGLAPIPIIAALPFATSQSAYTETTTPLPPARVPIIPKIFAYGCPTRAPGDARRLHSVMATFLQSPMPDSIRKKRAEQAQKVTHHVKAEEATPLVYILTPDQMVDNDFKLPSYVTLSDRPYIPGGIPKQLESVLGTARGDDASHDQVIATSSQASTVNQGSQVPVVDEQGRRRKGNVRGEEGWIETLQATKPPYDGVYPVLGLDCEMCLSEDGQELARVSVVDLGSDTVIFDELVKPPKPVTDYLTRFSGLTEEQMRSATYTLETVQAALVTGPNPIITPHTILLGHSLDCDLAVLKIRHPLVIDTSVLYQHPRGPGFKPGLKWLTQKWLGKEIQAGEQGHDSEEDARACLDLLRMKLRHGPQFGDASVDTESIFERVGRFKRGKDIPGKTSVMCDYGNPKSWYGSKATTAVPCTTDDEVVDGMISNVASHDLTFGRLMDLSNVQHWNVSDKAGLGGPDDPEAIGAAIARFNARLERLHSSLPSRAALILLTGHSDPREMLRLINKRQNWERVVRQTGGTESLGADERWMSEDDRQLEAAVAQAREGMAFFCVKQ